MDAKKQEVYDTYLMHLSIKGLAKATVALYTREAKEFIEFVDDLETVNTSIAYNYLSKYSHLANISKNLHYSALRSFTRFLLKNVYYRMDKVRIRDAKTGRRLPEILDQRELMKRFALIKERVLVSNNWIHKRNYALVMLLYSTGMRISEAMNFKRVDIEDNNWVRIENGKGAKTRYVPIAESAIKALDMYIEACPHSLYDHFFISYQKTPLSRISAYKILKHLLGLGPHDMRHHFATHMIINGCDISIVSELLGHSSLITTQIYTHIQKPQLAATVKRCHPMSEQYDYAV